MGNRGSGNLDLERGLRRAGVAAELVDPDAALAQATAGDVALLRLDVLRTLDGVEPGLDGLAALEKRGARLLNRPEALLRAHDKLLTAAVLGRAGVPHPLTAHLLDPLAPLPFPPPLVLKPRFGSWGVDVFRCGTEETARACLLELSERPWFRSHGVLVQELVDAPPRDTRIVVAGARMVGAVERRPQPGEWRTNVSLGAARAPVSPTPQQLELALAAVAAAALDLSGVDLLRGRSGDVVVELNGAVDFDADYSLPGRDIYRDIAVALGIG